MTTLAAATLPVTVDCACGTTSRARVGADQPWTCPCGRAWRLDDGAATLLGAVAKLRRLRAAVTVSMLAAAAVGIAAGLVHLQLFLAIPVLVGGVGIALRPTWRRRRDEVRKLARQPVGLVAG